MSMLSRLLSRPSTAVRIEPMRRRHVPAVLSIEVVSYPRPWTETVFHNELEMARRQRLDSRGLRDAGPFGA